MKTKRLIEKAREFAKPFRINQGKDFRLTHVNPGETLEIVYPIRFTPVPGPSFRSDPPSAVKMVERKPDRFKLTNLTGRPVDVEWEAVGVREPDKGP